MQLLVKRLGHCQVHPYYVYVHDLVKGVEDLRTTLQTALDIEKARARRDRRASTRRRSSSTRPGGGGKRVAHSFEHYDRETGISVFAAPSVKPGFFLYFDPIDTLAPEIQARWKIAAEQDRMIDDAIAQGEGERRLERARVERPLGAVPGRGGGEELRAPVGRGGAR